MRKSKAIIFLLMITLILQIVCNTVALAEDTNEEAEQKKLTFGVDIVADNEKVLRGDTFTVTTSIDEMDCRDDQGILAMTGMFEYNKEFLEIESMQGVNGWNFNENDFNPENFKFVVERDNLINKPGNIFEVVFKVKEDITLGNTTIKISNVEAGTGEDVNGLVEAKNKDVEVTVEIVEEEVPPVILRGDLDLSGKVDANDLAKMKLHCIGIRVLTGDSLKAALLDENDKVDANDLAILKRMLIGLE